jgi:pSer/pThr/pTyr-binding forkhead associated (FHA) protein
MDKCPYCGAETRPGDNFCLNCGNRLLSTPSQSSQQAQPAMGEATLAAPDDWAESLGQGRGGSGAGWPVDDGRTIAASGSEPPVAPPVQTAMDNFERPGRLVLRSENGEVLQEYTLDKPEMTIGRAPSSDILLSKDKLTSRRHATVHYEDGHYTLRDERSANGTFINGQQIDEMVPRTLQDGDRIGIGEHELIFHSSNGQVAHVEDMPTIAVPLDSAGSEATFGTRDDELATIATSDESGTHSMVDVEEGAKPAAVPGIPATPMPAQSVPVSPLPSSSPQPESAPPQVEHPPAEERAAAPATSGTSDAGMTFNRLTSLPLPTLPDISALIAALSTLDGQVTALQEQLNATQDAMRNHEAEIGQTANQLRSGIRRVSERMDTTIADVARSRESLAWAELLQLIEDVMNNPRDIEYASKLTRRARDLNKVFQIHQNVLNTMAECNSLLRSMIGDEK